MAAFDDLLVGLRRLGVRRRRRMRLYLWLVSTTGGVWLWAHFVCLAGRWTTGHFPWWFYATSCLFGALLVALLLERLRQHGAEMAMARRVAECDDLRAVGAFVDELAQLDYQTYPAVVKALTRLLPRLGGDESGLLGEPQRSRLRAALRQAADRTSSGYDVAFARAIMGALGRLGDARSLPDLRRVAGQDGLDGDEALAAAAREALAELECRQSTARLVRPAAAPRDETLVQPSVGAPGTLPEQMVRPYPPYE